MHTFPAANHLSGQSADISDVSTYSESDSSCALVWVCGFGLLLFSLLMPVYATDPLRMATVPALAETGLLDEVKQVFEREYGIELKVELSDSSRALIQAEEGDVDIVLVHNSELEQAFIMAGHGIDRRPVMYSDFVIAGSRSDPARVAEVDSAGMVFRRIALSQMPFISLGNGSATHRKELELWAAGRLQPGGRRYITAGSNLHRAFETAQQYQAYMLVERRSYMAHADRINLRILYADDPLLYQPYHIIAVNPERHPDVRHEQARVFIEFITGPVGQQLIGDFRLDDEPVFFPGVPPQQ